MSHSVLFLIEFRKRIINIVIGFGALFALSFYFSDQLFHWYMLPLLHHIPYHHLLATQITSPLLTPLNIAANIAFLGISPYVLYQIWGFISPALYIKEQRNVLKIMTISIGLFTLGALFCYFFILPLMFSCIVGAVPSDVSFMPDIGSATQFITWMMLVFGLSFQIPLMCALLVQIKICRHEQLVSLRPYIIVAAFILGMILTPPDVLSQILLAIPLWGLYELGLLLSKD